MTSSVNIYPKFISCLWFVSTNLDSTTDTNSLSLHDALPISFPDHPLALPLAAAFALLLAWQVVPRFRAARQWRNKSTGDRKSTRLNSSHVKISYAVFCLKKKTLQRIKQITK